MHTQAPRRNRGGYGEEGLVYKKVLLFYFMTVRPLEINIK